MSLNAFLWNPLELDQIISGIKQGNLLALSKGITLVESGKPEHRLLAMQLINALFNEKNDSIRLGITGIPGVGKSTFIEQLGLEIIQSGKKLAVLAIDPSSNRSGGSILGDKTRMEELSRNSGVFIRPSPSGGNLGGVAARTRDSMLLCEAAGFDVIIIETVGVGQSEVEVINITDTFLMLAMPGTGDELQGIKRGIMETADMIVINKADGVNREAARRAKMHLEMALHLFPMPDSGWAPKVMLASALQKEGIVPSWKSIKDRQDFIQKNGWLNANRRMQQLRAFKQMTHLNIYERITEHLNQKNELADLESKVKSGQLNEFEASIEVIHSIEKIFRV